MFTNSSSSSSHCTFMCKWKRQKMKAYAQTHTLTHLHIHRHRHSLTHLCEKGEKRTYFAIYSNIGWLEIHMFGINQTSKIHIYIVRIRWRERKRDRDSEWLSARKKKEGKLCVYFCTCAHLLNFFRLFFIHLRSRSHIQHKVLFIMLLLTYVQVAKESYELAICVVRNRWVLLLCFLILSRSKPKSWFILRLYNDHCFWVFAQFYLMIQRIHCVCALWWWLWWLSYFFSHSFRLCYVDCPFSHDIVKLQIIKLH